MYRLLAKAEAEADANGKTAGANGKAAFAPAGANDKAALAPADANGQAAEVAVLQALGRIEEQMGRLEKQQALLLES